MDASQEKRARLSRDDPPPREASEARHRWPADIRQRNPGMRGWAQDHQHGASKRTFATVDHHLCTLLGQWAQRRRPPHRVGGSRRNTCGLSTETETGCALDTSCVLQGKLQDVRLFRARSVPIRRHTKIHGEANTVYDPQWEPYFAARSGVRMARNLQGRRQLLRLWTVQEGLCAVCQHRLTQVTGWQSPHLVWRTARRFRPGGKPGSAPSKWSCPGPYPTVRGGETASSTGR